MGTSLFLHFHPYIQWNMIMPTLDWELTVVVVICTGSSWENFPCRWGRWSAEMWFLGFWELEAQLPLSGKVRRFFSNQLWFFLMKTRTLAGWHSCSGFKDLLYNIWCAPAYRIADFCQLNEGMPRALLEAQPFMCLWGCLQSYVSEISGRGRSTLTGSTTSWTRVPDWVKPEKRVSWMSASWPLPGCRCTWPAASGSSIHSHLPCQNSPPQNEP